MVNGLAAARADWDPTFVDRLAEATTWCASTTAGLAIRPVTAAVTVDDLRTAATRPIRSLALGPARRCSARPMDSIASSTSPARRASRRAADRAALLPERARQIDEQFGDIVAEARAALPPESWTSRRRSFDLGRPRPQLGDIRCPTLVATGADDVVVPPANSLALAAGIDAGRPLSSSGHGFMADHPAPGGADRDLLD